MSPNEELFDTEKTEPQTERGYSDKKNKGLFFALYYISKFGKMDGAAVDMNSFMKEIGLRKGEHYEVRSFENPNSQIGLYLDFCGGTLLEIYSNPFDLPIGGVIGYQMVGDFFKKNKKRIKQGLEDLK